jgi:diacylglycerol kinase family enzyme
MAVLVLLNAKAGTIAHASDKAFDETIRKGLAERGVTADVRLVEGDQIVAMAKEHVEQAGDEPQTVIVGGGDGTLGSVAAILAGTPHIFGVLPLGTLNHFAKDLGIPMEIEGAMDVIAAGQSRPIDVAEVNGKVFINNSSVGLYPFLVDERTAEQERIGAGKPLAMMLALGRAVRVSSWERVRVVVNGEAKQVRTPCVFIGNNLYDPKALGRRKALDGGTLCVYIVKRQSWAGLALLPFKMAIGIVDPERDVEIVEAQSVEISARRPQLRIATDGETSHEATPLHYKIRPGALKVLAPSEAAPAGGSEETA